MTISFASRLLAWFDLYGRKDLPWQHPATPYRVWVSEIMLQQTQVMTVIPYFMAFMARFPDVYHLASADQSEVLRYWSGLGYYARARNLHASAQKIVTEFNGVIPDSADTLLSLSGIGKSTAHAILSLAYHQPKAICDGNVKRVLARWLALPDEADKPLGQARLWQVAEALQSTERPADYTQAMMDLGASLCTRSKPACPLCPVRQDCQALALAQTQSIQVTDYPKKSKKAIKPERACDMYLLQAPNGAFWLSMPHQETGLWGGLYQLPQSLPDEMSSLAHSCNALTQVQHVFTHFKLNIQPYWLKLSMAQADWLSRYEQGDWYFSEQKNLAHPAIVDKLIRQV